MTWVELDEVRVALRRLANRPTASVVSIFALASGIGAAAVASSLMSAVLLKPVHIANPDRLMVVGTVYTGRGGGPARTSFSHTYPTIAAVNDSGAFQGVTAGGRWDVLIDEGGPLQSRSAYFASQTFFEVTGAGLQIGRAFSTADDQRGAPPVAILSDRYWRRVFGGDRSVVGRLVKIGEVPVTVIGVTAASFRGLSLTDSPDIYLPLHIVGDLGNTSTNFFADTTRKESPTAWVTVLGRLKVDSSIEQSIARLNALPPAVRRGGSFVVTDVNTAAVPEVAQEGMRGFGRLLAATVGLLLLIAGLTVGLLLLIRSEARQGEFAMCLALGASRLRVAAGIAIEGAMLSAGGAVLAVPVAWWLFGALRTYQLPGGVLIDRLDLTLDNGMLMVAAAGAIGATMLIALVAASFGFSANLAEALRTRAGGTPQVARRRTRSALVAAQVAVTLVLLAGATLLGQSLLAALRLNPGFETTRLVSGSVSLGGRDYTPERANEFFDALLARMDRSPSIRAASLMQSMGGMTTGGKLKVDGVFTPFPSFVAYVSVDDRYFPTMGMSVVTGRNFNNADRATSPLVIMVSESLGRLLARGGDPVGHQITESSAKIGQAPDVATVVGVVPDIVTNVNILAPLAVYYTRAQRPPSLSSTLVVRASGDASVASADMLSAIREMDPTLAPAPFLTMEERIGRQMGPQRFGALVLGVLAVIAVLLTILGAYVLAESMAAMRQREIGIRAALGATRASLSSLLLTETLRLVGIGIVAGLGLTWLGAGTIRAFLYQVQPLDVTTLASVSAAILVLTLAVSMKPAIRTSRRDLARVLREE
jgi:predicted permease